MFVDTAQVFLQMRQLVEKVITQRTTVRFLPSVLAQVHLQRRGVRELLRADLWSADREW